MERPALTHTVGEKEIKWTYGLQRDMERMLPDAEQAITEVLTNPYTRDYLVRRALTDIKKSVTDEAELIAIEDIDLDPDEQLALLDWVTGHLLYFFSRSAANLSRQGLSFKTTLDQLAPSTTGSEASAS